MTHSAYDMVAAEEALAVVLEQAQPLTRETVALDDCLDRILAEEVTATEPLPPFHASVKDGYAVVAADGPGTYRIVGEATAGRVADFRVEPGTVAYITTGAPLPRGADAVVMVEKTERREHNRVAIRASVQAGDDVRPLGIDVATGQVVLEVGARIGAAEMGLLATVGAVDVPVYPVPRVGVLSTGDELVEPHETPGPGQIRDSNRTTLLAAIRAAGGAPVDLGIAGDSQTELEMKIHAGLVECDILLSSGGVSMGDLDLVKPLLEHAGTVHFGRVRMKPGKPVTFATAEVNGRRRLIFGLPGNPVSSLVTFYLFGVPALRRMAGWRHPELTRVQAQLAQPLSLDPQRPEYHRASLRWSDSHGGFVASSTGIQASSRLLSMRSANALLVLPQREGRLEAGETVPALLIGDVDVAAT